MKLGELIKEIDSLSVEERMEIYLHLASTLKKREQIQAILEKFRGKGKGVWDMDAQEYINQLRANDRF